MKTIYFSESMRNIVQLELERSGAGPRIRLLKPSL